MNARPLKFVTTDIDVELRGRYHTESGRPRGLVVHYTAGRFSAPDAAQSTLRYMASQKLGCMVMGLDGTIYMPRNQDEHDVAFHAGKSEWKGVEAISCQCMGMEIVNAGKLTDTGVTWYGEQLTRSQIRTIATKEKNQAPGLYHAFTKAQESALINFCLHQLGANPEFSIDWIVGHDEIAPTRKTDPGGSLSMPMDDFRNVIRVLSGKDV